MIKEKVTYELSFAYNIAKYYAKHPIVEHERTNASDEEVRDFVRLFMRPARKRNLRYTSQGLKHIAEQTIGSIFRGGEYFAYVSNEQLKRIVKENPLYNPKAADADGVDEYYYFTWSCDAAKKMLDAFGITATYSVPSLLSDTEVTRLDY